MTVRGRLALGGKAAAGSALLLAAVAVAWALLALLASRGSLLGDEAFYAGVALESQRAGQVFPLVVNGGAYIEKPPLPIWLVSASLRALGPSTFAARLPALLAGFAVIALVAARAAREWGPAAGGAAALILASLPVANGLDGNHGLASGTGDSILLLLLLVTGLSLDRALAAGRPGACAVALAAAFLSAWTKGAAGPAFLTLALPWLALGSGPRRDGSPSARCPLSLSLAAISSAWLGFGSWVLCLHVADVPRIYERLFQKGIVRRLVEGLDSTHRQGPAYYLEVLVRDFGPGLLVVAGAIAIAVAGRKDEAESRLRRRLALAALTWIFALTLPVSKLAWYLLPAYPLLVWLLAATCHQLATGGGPHPRAIGVLLALFSLVWPASRTAAELAAPERRHALEVALAELSARGADGIDVDPGLGFGRRRQLDATEYFLAEALRRAGDDRLEPNAASGCRGWLTSVAESPSRPASGPEDEPLWTGAAQPSGDRPALYLRCVTGH